MSNLALCLKFDGRPIRLVGKPDRPEWVAADVVAALGLKGTGPHHTRGFKATEKGVQRMDTPGGIQTLLTVYEPGLYRLIFRSDKPAAERFRTWVTHDVLPSLRRFGQYPPPPEPLPPGTEPGLFGPVPATGALPYLPPVLPAKAPPGLAEAINPRTGLMPLRDVPNVPWLPRRPSLRTVFEWHRYGRCRGVKLEAIPSGGMLWTSEAAVLLFLLRCAQPCRADLQGLSVLAAATSASPAPPPALPAVVAPPERQPVAPAAPPPATIDPFRVSPGTADPGTRLISLAEAARLPWLSKRPALSTVYRWIEPGLVGVGGRTAKLETVKEGGRTSTTEDAMLRFFERLGQARAAADVPQDPHGSPGRTTSQVAAAHRRATASLAAVGI